MKVHKKNTIPIIGTYKKCSKYIAFIGMMPLTGRRAMINQDNPSDMFNKVGRFFFIMAMIIVMIARMITETLIMDWTLSKVRNAVYGFS
jgi:hypothetical protein